MPVFVGYSGQWVSPKDLYAKDPLSNEWKKATSVYVGINDEWVLVDDDVPPPPAPLGGETP